MLSGTGARLHCSQGLALSGDGYQCGFDWKLSSNNNNNDNNNTNNNESAREFLLNLGRSITLHSGDNSEASFLF